MSVTGPLAHLLAAFDPDLPLERARTIPASWYTNQGMYAAEREYVFGRSWCVVGRAEQVARPGLFLTTEVAGWPILVVRDQEGVLRAFFNVCRHRAAPLLTEPCGAVTKLRCRYHGWTYDLAGRLRGTPEFDGVADFRREDNGLHPIEVAEWGPLVAVQMQATERGATLLSGGRQPPDSSSNQGANAPRSEVVSFTQHLTPLPERTAAGIAGLEFVERREYELRCNWKVYVDNYLDGGYHVNTVHPGLAGMLDYSQYRTETFASSSVQTSPLTTGAGSVRAGVAQYWFVFPNSMLNLYDGVMDTNLVLPLGPDRCRVVFDFYYAGSGPAADPAFRAQSVATAHQIQEEDLGICEEVQRGLASGAFDSGRFSVKREAAGYHFHQLLARCLRSKMTNHDDTTTMN